MADQGFEKEVANIYARFMRQDNLNEESGLPIGSDKETSYLKELASNKEVKDKSKKDKQNKVNRFYGCEPKQMPKQTIPNNLDQ